MKILLINGSPHERGCTHTALAEMEKAIRAEGLDTEILWIGQDAVRGCTGCGACFKMKKNRCVFDADAVNRVLEKCEEADGFVFGSPVHYASAGGSITSLMDRMFYAGSRLMRHKPACAVVSARRAGTTAAIDQLNKYFTISGMPIASSQYWPMVHGNTPEEVMQDEEGLQIMRTLGRNLVWMVKSFALARENGILPPAPEAEKKRTNFIR
ncbi:MAG: flavodoxin family protein [Clostridia bacterium]|nr:flavodoxin family protein [Clostridia bacterium]MBQ4608446.1 flavodoxin family protein [Clostridia bacterium]MBQ6858900.1 flavodoxin family protein [Clostridia bacterium]